jgi:inorganic pyrophosphatase
MDVSKISIGKNPPCDVNVVIEIPAGSPPVKYEIDKKSGALFVDRFMQTAMHYPCHYGFIPNTLSEDGDPCDVLVVVDVPVVPGCVINARPIGVLMMEDEAGFDEKILAVPSKYPSYTNIESYEDLPASIIKRITHFFQNYKGLEENKWVKVKGWEGAEKAREMILKSINRAKSHV